MSIPADHQEIQVPKVSLAELRLDFFFWCTAPFNIELTIRRIPRRPWLWPFACPFERPFLITVQTFRVIGYHYDHLLFPSLFDRQIYSRGRAGSGLELEQLSTLRATLRSSSKNRNLHRFRLLRKRKRKRTYCASRGHLNDFLSPKITCELLAYSARVLAFNTNQCLTPSHTGKKVRKNLFWKT